MYYSVFLTEFAEARRKVPAGPIVTFTAMPPKEIQDAFNITEAKGNVGFISFGKRFRLVLLATF